MKTGSPVRMFGTCQDITDSRRAQADALARQNLESMAHIWYVVPAAKPDVVSVTVSWSAESTGRQDPSPSSPLI